MRELRTSGSVGDLGGNTRVYPTKLGGGRNIEGVPIQKPSPLGGIQGGPGKIFGIPYAPGSLVDRFVEVFAGPHDYLNSGYWYNSSGNAYNRSGLSGYFGEALNFANVAVATPFVASSVTQVSAYPVLYQVTDDQ